MPTVDYEDDEAVCNHIESNHTKLQERIDELKSEKKRQDLYGLLKGDSSSAVSVIKDFISSLPEEEKQKFVQSL